MEQEKSSLMRVTKEKNEVEKEKSKFEELLTEQTKRTEDAESKLEEIKEEQRRTEDLVKQGETALGKKNEEIKKMQEQKKVWEKDRANVDTLHKNETERAENEHKKLEEEVKKKNAAKNELQKVEEKK